MDHSGNQWMPNILKFECRWRNNRFLVWYKYDSLDDFCEVKSWRLLNESPLIHWATVRLLSCLRLLSWSFNEKPPKHVRNAVWRDKIAWLSRRVIVDYRRNTWSHIYRETLLYKAYLQVGKAQSLEGLKLHIRLWCSLWLPRSDYRNLCRYRLRSSKPTLWEMSWFCESAKSLQWNQLFWSENWWNF